MVSHTCGHRWAGKPPRCKYCHKNKWLSTEPCPICDKPNHLLGRCVHKAERLDMLKAMYPEAQH